MMVEIQLKTVENRVYAWCEKYGITMSGHTRDQALSKMKRALQHLASKLIY